MLYNFRSCTKIRRFLEGSTCDYSKIHGSQDPRGSSFFLITRLYYSRQGLQEINNLTPPECGQALHSTHLETDTACDDWAVAEEGQGTKQDGGLGFDL